MIQRQITNNTMERFMKCFKEKCDYLKQNGHVRYIPEIEVSMVVDAINLWEQEKAKLLTLRDQALLYPEQHPFPNSAPNSEGSYNHGIFKLGSIFRMNKAGAGEREDCR